MNKAELVVAAAAKLDGDLTQKDVRRSLDAAMTVITEALACDDKVVLVGFGTFSAQMRKEREGRNPSTGAVISIPARKMPKFAPGKELKQAVAGE